MQDVCIYSFRTPPLSRESAARIHEQVVDLVDGWLVGKGVAAPKDATGTFTSLTANGNGNFCRQVTTSDLGDLEDITLEELSNGGQIFTTSVSIAVLPSAVAVYARLAVTNIESVIAPVSVYPRCPAVIRDIVNMPAGWVFGDNALPPAKAQLLVGDEGAAKLAAEIQSAGRLFPIVVISEIEGETIWPKVADEIAFDLAGLALVARIDEHASWRLTEALGKQHSCYRGAIRLYWPVRRDQPAELSLRGTVWTASALLATDDDGKGLNRFRSLLRRTVMSTAALTIVPPQEIQEIKSSATHKQLAILEARADSNSEELQFARMYVAENDQLKAELTAAKSAIAQAVFRAEAAEYGLEKLKEKKAGTTDGASEMDPEAPPKTGETRYYKKVHSKPAYDVLVEITDCGHANWQNAAKADKAKKGIEKLAGSNDWKSVNHCGVCTGGGVWRVKW